MATELNEDVAMAEIVNRLAEKWPQLSRDRITEVVDEARASHADAKVRDFIPVLVERAAKDVLKPEAKALKEPKNA